MSMADAMNGLKTAKKGKARVDEVKGYLDDINKIRSLISHIHKPRVESSGELIKLGYEGLTRIASLEPSGFLSRYMAYYQGGINSVAGLITVRNMSASVYKLARNYEKRVVEFEHFSASMCELNSIAASMINQDGKYPKDLPREFKEYFQLMEMPIDGVTMSQGAEEETAGRRAEIGTTILARARDVAAARLVFEKDFWVVAREMVKANLQLQSLLRSEGSGDNIGGKSVVRDTQHDYVLSGFSAALANDTVFHLSQGTIGRSKGAARIRVARNDLEELSEEWRKWAQSVKDNDHLNLY